MIVTRIGREFRVVLVSTVMTSKGNVENYQTEPNLFSDRKMLNTVFSRARSLVLAFGETDSLTNCKIGNVWKQFIRESWKARSLMGDRDTPKYLKELKLSELRLSNLEQNSEAINAIPATAAAQCTDSDDDCSSDDEVMVRSLGQHLNRVAVKRLTSTGSGNAANDDDAWLRVEEEEGLENVEWQLSRRRDNKEAVYETHWSVKEMEKANADNPAKYVRCHLKVLGRGDNCRGIPIDPSQNEILIEGYRRRNRAYDGELVLVETVSSSTENDSPRIGQVRGIFRKQRPTHFVCQLMDGKTHRFAPIDSSHPILINCPSRFEDYHNRHGDCVHVFESLRESKKLWEKKKWCIRLKKSRNILFVVEYVKWKELCTYPMGIVIDVVDPGLTYQQGLGVLDIETIGYNELQEYSGEQNEMETADCDDIPSISNAFTIDPPQAEDLDDALAVRSLEGGLYQVDVFITDVDSIVKRGSPDDTRARALATSVYDYKGGVRLPMLPKWISAKKCSLLPNRPRRVIAVSFTLDAEGNQKGYQFSSKIIQSCCKLSYEAAEDVIAGRTPDVICYGVSRDDLYSRVRLLHKMSLNIRARRFGRNRSGAGRSDATGSAAFAHHLVEEFMIMTNQAVAEELLEKCRNECILNSQSPPSESKLNEWSQQVGRYALAFPTLFEAARRAGISEPSSRSTFQSTVHVPKVGLDELVRDIDSIADDENAVMCVNRFMSSDRLLPQLALWLSKYGKLQRRARYVTVLNDVDYPTKHHQFGTFYCHFTSPLRRFVDLVTHRLLKRCVLANSAATYDTKETTEISFDCSSRRQLAKKFGRQSLTLKLACDVQFYPVSTVAVVEDITGSHIDLFVPDCPSFPYGGGRIRFSSLNAIDANLERAVDPPTAYLKWEISLLSSRWDDEIENENLPEETFALVDFGLWMRLAAQCRNRESEATRESVLRMLGEIKRSTVVLRQKSKADKIGLDGQDDSNSIIEKRVSVSDLLSIQVASRMQRGMLQPFVQLLRLSDGLSICIEHNTRPAECFSSTLSVPPQPSSFSSLSEYVRYWTPVVEIESATTSVKASGRASACLIRDMAVEWKYLENGDMIGYLEIRKQFAECYKIAYQRGSYVCLRYFDLDLPEDIKEGRKEEGSRGMLWRENSPFCSSDKYNVVLHCQVISVDEDLFKAAGEPDVRWYSLRIRCYDSRGVNFTGLRCSAQFIHSSIPSK